MSDSATLADALARTLQGQPMPARVELAGARVLIRAPGVVELAPKQVVSGAPATVLSAGIHGDETAPIELLCELATRLDAGTLVLGAPTLLIVGHPPAIAAGKRYLQTNLNRLFHHDRARADNSDEHRRARALMAAVDAFWRTYATPAGSASGGIPLHLDMHAAIRASRYPCFAVAPFSATPTPAAVWPVLTAAGIQAVLIQHASSWTFSHYSRYVHGVTGFTFELGQVAAFGDNDLGSLASMQALLAARVEARAPNTADPEGLAFFEVAGEVIRRGDEFELTFTDDTPNFTRFAPGELLARDPGYGDTRVQGEAGIVVFPNAAVERGARAMLLARPGAVGR